MENIQKSFNYKGEIYPCIIAEHDGKGYLFATMDLKQAILENKDDPEAQIIAQQVYQYIPESDFDLPDDIFDALYFTDWIV